MKKTYINPSANVFYCQGMQMLAASKLGSARITTQSNGNPLGEDLNDVGGDSGSGDYAVKGMWDY